MSGIVDFSELKSNSDAGGGIVDFSELGSTGKSAPVSMESKYGGAEELGQKFLSGNIGGDDLKKAFLKLPVPDRAALMKMMPKPPMAFADFNPMNSLPIKTAEEVGGDVKKSAQSAIGNIVANAPPKFIPQSAVEPYQRAKLGAGLAASTVTELAPFTPSELTIAAGGEMLPGALVPKTISEKVPNAIGNILLDTSNRVLEKELSKGAENSGIKLIESELGQGSRHSLLNQSAAKIDGLEKQISGIVNSSNGTINKYDLVNGIDDMAAKMDLPGIYPAEVRRIQRVIDNFLSKQPDQIPIQMANDIKRQIYSMVGNKGYLTQTPSVIVATQKTLANALKTEIEKIIPGIADLNAQQGKFMGFRDMLVHASAPDSKSVTKALYGAFEENAGLRTGRMLHDLPRTRGVGGVASGIKFSDEIRNRQNGGK